MSGYSAKKKKRKKKKGTKADGKGEGDAATSEGDAPSTIAHNQALAGSDMNFKRAFMDAQHFPGLFGQLEIQPREEQRAAPILIEARPCCRRLRTAARQIWAPSPHNERREPRRQQAEPQRR